MNHHTVGLSLGATDLHPRILSEETHDYGILLPNVATLALYNISSTLSISASLPRWLMTVTLISLRSAYETSKSSLWGYLWGCFQGGLTKGGDPMHPKVEGPGRIKEEKKKTVRPRHSL